MRPANERDAEGVYARAFFSPGHACLEAIVGELDDATATVDICVFTITDDRISKAVLAAHRRNVRVRIVTDNDKSNDEGSDIARLARAGIEVRVDRSPHHMHHKFAIVDGRRLLNGSYNRTRSAAEHHQENVVLTDQGALVEAFSGAFEALWQKPP